MNTTELTFKELELQVDYQYFAGEEMQWTLPNGDPGHPGSPPDVEIEEIRVMDVEGDFYNIDLYHFFSEIGLLDELKQLIIDKNND